MNDKVVKMNNTDFKLYDISFWTCVASNIKEVLHSWAEKDFCSIFVIEQIVIYEILFEKATKFGFKIGIKAIYKLIFINFYIRREDL